MLQILFGVGNGKSGIISQVTNNLISDDDGITLTCIKVDDFIDSLLLEWFLSSKVELISTITSDQLVLATSISDKVVTICSFYFLTLLAVTSDCKGQVDVGDRNGERVVNSSCVIDASNITNSDIANARVFYIYSCIIGDFNYITLT